jgi:predicted branched-subunit amino acid permease
VQFTLAALLNAGAGTGALVAGALALNLRNLLLGAVLRPRLEGGTLRRVALAWFVTDESTGLSLIQKEEAGHTLFVTGVMFYVAWQVGTILGSIGASLQGVAHLAEATFPVLFIGLAAIGCRTRAVALRAVAGAAATIAVIAVAPDLSAVAAVAAALAAALPGRE